MTPADGPLPRSAPAGDGRARPRRLEGDALRALRDREPAALELFYDTYFARIHGYVRRAVRDEHAAEDLTQDIFMHIHRSLASYDPQRDLRPWVFTIAANKLRDFWQSRRFQERRRQVSTDDPAAGAELAAGLPGPRERLESREAAEAVAEAIRSLPEGLRTPLVLRYYEGLSFEEIGAVLQRTEVAARKRYSRALAELRRLLAPTLDPGGRA